MKTQKQALKKIIIANIFMNSWEKPLLSLKSEFLGEWQEVCFSSVDVCVHTYLKKRPELAKASKPIQASHIISKHFHLFFN